MSTQDLSNRTNFVNKQKGIRLLSKVCRGCGIDKPRKDFIGPNKKSKTPYYVCLSCLAEQAKKYRAENREKYLNTKRVHRFKKLFGISVEEYDFLLKAQKNVCAICFKKDKNVRLAVDHDHRTGKIRGLLCAQCNRGIGQLGDNSESLMRAYQYLKTSETQGISSTDIKRRANESNSNSDN